ncbi:MAG TPA: histidine ammonia-lyase, partial [Gammaproteobacteria bacterium]|nr:histidine ammonia-lyase [Gammaproteobacteria bacterium]
LATLGDRQITKLLDSKVSHLPEQLLAKEDGYIGVVGMAVVAYLEEATRAAQVNLLPGSEGGGFGQNDIGVPTFWAFNQHQTGSSAFDAVLAYLGVTASQALYVTGRTAPPALKAFLEAIRSMVPPVTDSRALGSEVEILANQIDKTVFGTSSTVNLEAL